MPNTRFDKGQVKLLFKPHNLFSYLYPRARAHVGMAMGLDTLRMMAIDIDIRAVTDFLVFKSQGVMGLAKELYFIYRFLEPSKLANMPQDKFVVLHRGGSIGVGEFAEIPWHKQEKEHILKVLGIEVTYGEEIDYGKNLGDFNTVSDHEHIMLIDDYVQGTSQKNIAAMRGRSSATINSQISEHNVGSQSWGTAPDASV